MAAPDRMESGFTDREEKMSVEKSNAETAESRSAAEKPGGCLMGETRLGEGRVQNRAAQVVLSERLKMLANMVSRGNRLVDVGCDHGYLAIDLVASGICPGAIAMDVREGPLAAARGHVKACALEDYISIRLSDGLEACEAQEAETMVCAGMGGRLMERILREGVEKARGMKELILQPQSELGQFRAFLRKQGFVIVDEDAVFEDGKYYFAMKAVPGRKGYPGCGLAEADGEKQQIYDIYGEILLKKRHPVLGQYLLQREGYMKKLEHSLAAAGTRKAEKRLEEVRSELAGIAAARSIWV